MASIFIIMMKTIKGAAGRTSVRILRTAFFDRIGWARERK